MFNEFANAEFDSTLFQKVNNYNIWFVRLMFICLSTFEWEGLPKSCNSRYLEQTLFYNGQAAFYDSENYGIINSKCIPANSYNQYLIPTKYNLISLVWNWTVNTEDIVHVRNNAICSPSAVFVAKYAQKLATLEQAIETNLAQQKFSTAILCDDKERLTFKNLIQKYNGGQPFIYGSKTLKLSGIQPLQLNSPFIADKLYEMYKKVYYDCLRFFGVETPSSEKKERVQTAEITAANAATNMNIAQGLEFREKACKELNEKYNLNVSVKMRKYTLAELEREFENGNIYSGTQNIA